MTLEASLKKIFFLFVLLNISCDFEPNYTLLKGSTFGTYYQIKFFEFDEENHIIEKEIDSIFNHFNNSLSTYIQSSIISKVNRNEKVIVDDLFDDIFKKSKLIYKKTGGYFDPSIGKLLDYAGFGPIKNKNLISKDSLNMIFNTVGFDKIEIIDGEVKKLNYESKLDFNAIAKGYAVDVISEFLISKSIYDFMVDIGGEIRTSGKNKSKDMFWSIAIENPIPNKTDDNFYKRIKLQNAAIATSGNYRNFRIDSVTGKKYVHIINPINGEFEQTNILSVSVISYSCFVSDAFATAMMAGNLDNAQKLTLENDDIESMIIYLDDNDELKSFISEGFQKFIY